MTLEQLKIGQRCKVKKVLAQGMLKRKLLEMGITPGAEILFRKVAPLGDPIQISLRGYELSIRKVDAKNISVEIID
ncbi:MAG TPA: ferrous iron transport protein A [Clostridiales bacterium]|jgi:ferrous iron transport protein A|nr:ferrous iron transport protein A [Clostridiales bacterium]